MKCQYCDNELPANTPSCPSCGAAVQQSSMQQPQGQQQQFQQQPQIQQPQGVPKSRVAYVLLAVFLGTLGIHNFYAGYTSKGIIQLLITVCTCGYAGIVSWIWAIVEACTVTADAKNVPMQ